MCVEGGETNAVKNSQIDVFHQCIHRPSTIDIEKMLHRRTAAGVILFASALADYNPFKLLSSNGLDGTSDPSDGLGLGAYWEPCSLTGVANWGWRDHQPRLQLRVCVVVASLVTLVDLHLIRRPRRSSNNLQRANRLYRH